MVSGLLGSLKTASTVYLTAFVGSSILAVFDNQYNILGPEEGNPRNHMIIGNYSVDIGGEEKTFTFIGERHIYTENEIQTTKALIDSLHGKEGLVFGGEAIISEEYRERMGIIEEAHSLMYNVPIRALSIGEDLEFDNREERILEYAMSLGYEPKSLGDPRMDANTLLEDIQVLSMATIGTLMAPVLYFVGDYAASAPQLPIETILDNENSGNLHRRDVAMANGIEELLRQDDVDHLVVNVGTQHYGPIIRDLQENLDMDLIDRIYYPEEDLSQGVKLPKFS